MRVEIEATKIAKAREDRFIYTWHTKSTQLASEEHRILQKTKAENRKPQDIHWREISKANNGRVKSVCLEFRRFGCLIITKALLSKSTSQMR